MGAFLAVVFVTALIGGFLIAGKVVEKTWAQLLLGVVFGAGLIVAAGAVFMGIAFAGCLLTGPPNFH